MTQSVLSDPSQKNDPYHEMDKVLKDNIKTFNNPFQKIDPSHEIVKALYGDVMNCSRPISEK